MLAVAFLSNVGVVYYLWAIDLGTGPVPLPFLVCVSNRYVAAIVPSSQSPCVCSMESLKNKTVHPLVLGFELRELY